MPRYTTEPTADETQSRYGRYHNSNFWDIPEFGSKKWVVGVHINVDFDQATNMNLEEEEQIIDACIKTLNQPPPRKKYARRIHTPKYGRLDLYKANIVERGGEKYVSALLITDKRTNKLFWGKGQNVVRSKR